MDPPLRRSLLGKGLPGPALGFLYAAGAISPLLLATLSGIEPADVWSEAATGTGMIGAVMLLLQLVSSGRFEALSGQVGIDVTMAFHKWAARVMILVLLLHPLLFAAPMAPDRLGTAFNHLAAMFVSPRYLSGVVALLLVVTLVLLALLRDRLPVPYEAWRASHGLLALAATWATVEHLLKVGTYSKEGELSAFWLILALCATAAALGVYTIRAWGMRHQTWRVVDKRHLAERLWKITIRGDEGERLSFRAGQFAWLAFAPRRFPLFDHPLSIASAPREGSELSFIVQEVGDFTRGIGSIPIGTAVGLDAPHGCFTLDESRSDAIVLVAGGVGVAPILGLLQDLVANKDGRPVRLIYGSRSRATLINPSEFQPLLDQLDARAWFLVDEPSSGWSHGTGLVSMAVLAKAVEGLDPRRVAAMVCGPAKMMTPVTEGLHELGVPYRNIRYERFDYGAGASSGKDRRVIAGFWTMAVAVAAAGIAFALR